MRTSFIFVIKQRESFVSYEHIIMSTRMCIHTHMHTRTEQCEVLFRFFFPSVQLASIAIFHQL